MILAQGALLAPVAVLPGIQRAQQWEMQQSTGKNREAGEGGGTQAPLAVATATPAVCPDQQGLERGVWGHCWAQARRCPHTHMLPQEATAAAALGVGWDEVGSELEVLLAPHSPSAVTATIALGTWGTPRQPCVIHAGPMWHREHGGFNTRAGTWGMPCQPCSAPEHGTPRWPCLARNSAA